MPSNSPIELRLIPTPGAKAEFLAAVEPLHKDHAPSIWRQIQATDRVIVLEGYTRDSWSLDTATKWTSVQVTAVDGRNKLPGFVSYLRERQKTAYGRFSIDEDGGGGGVKSSYVWVIPHKQASSTTLACRIALLSSIPNCPLKPKASAAPVTGENSSRRGPHTGVSTAAVAEQPKARPLLSSDAPPPATTTNGQPKKKGFGLLGNLVAGQRRTNLQVVTAAAATATINTTKNRGKANTPNSLSSSNANVPASAGGLTTPSTIFSNNDNGGGDKFANDVDDDDDDDDDLLKTSGQVLADFRHEMEQKMLNFDIAPDMVLKIHVQLSDHTKKVIENDKDKVTVEVLKYIVYEQAEEVNEEWITYKEPTEFVDEFTIAIYKDVNDAPPEVLEDMNKAEITDEMRAQQAALQEQRRQQEMKAARQQAQLQMQALRNTRHQGGGQGGDEDDDDFAVLNARKRDRRTIEDYQREAKRPKGE